MADTRTAFERKQDDETRAGLEKGVLSHRTKSEQQSLDVRAGLIVTKLENDPELKAAVLARIGIGQ